MSSSSGDDYQTTAASSSYGQVDKDDLEPQMTDFMGSIADYKRFVAASTGGRSAQSLDLNIVPQIEARRRIRSLRLLGDPYETTQGHNKYRRRVATYKKKNILQRAVKVLGRARRGNYNALPKRQQQQRIQRGNKKGKRKQPTPARRHNKFR